MPLYMDMHNIDGGVKAEDVAKAHRPTLKTQEQYGVRYLRYWVDEEPGKDLLPGRCAQRGCRQHAFTGRRTAWWPMRSSRCSKGSEARSVRPVATVKLMEVSQ